MSFSMISGNVQAAGVLSVSLTPAAVSANTTAAQTFTVPGLRVGDAVHVNPPGLTAGSALVGARVSAADTLSITWVNATGGSLTPPAGAYLVLVVRGGSAPSGFAP